MAHLHTARRGRVRSPFLWFDETYRFLGMGKRVRFAGGTIAITSESKQPPDVLLMDIPMPGLNGLIERLDIHNVAGLIKFAVKVGLVRVDARRRSVFRLS